MEAGDIPGAVRLFESAVQREPDNQLVSPIANSAPIHNNKDPSSFLFLLVISIIFPHVHVRCLCF